MINVEIQLIFIGRTESEADMMRSILAQLEYKYEICRYDSLGIPFCQHMYVPETNSVTYRSYHEREDEAHVLKVSRFLCLDVYTV